METPLYKINRLPSFSDFYDEKGPDIMQDIKDEILTLNDKIPQNVLNELLKTIDSIQYDIIEQSYTDYISTYYDRNNLRKVDY